MMMMAALKSVREKVVIERQKRANYSYLGKRSIDWEIQEEIDDQNFMGSSAFCR